MPYRQTYCINLSGTNINLNYILRFNPYRAINTFRIDYQKKINIVRGNDLRQARSEIKKKNATISFRGHAVDQLVEALRHKPEGRWFDSRLCH